MDNTKLTIVEIQELLKDKGIKFKKGLKKQHYLDLLDSMVEMGAPQRVLEMRCSKRLLIIVEDSDEQERNTDCFGYPTNCTNFAFEKSTGTSNKYNFKSVYMPIKRQDSDGWLNKHGGMGGPKSRELMMSILGTVIKSDLCGLNKDKCKSFNDVDKFLFEFIDRFGCWRQLQLSAALAKPGELWNIVPAAISLKKFAMSHNWCGKTSTDQIDKDARSKLMAYPESFRTVDLDYLTKIVINPEKHLSNMPELRKDIKDYTEGKVIAQKVKILRKYVEETEPQIIRDRAFIDALDYSNRIVSPINYLGFFYKRLNTMNDIDYTIDVDYTKCTIEESGDVVNQWLESSHALCEKFEDIDRVKKALIASEVPVASESSVERNPKRQMTDRDLDIKYSGWYKI